MIILCWAIIVVGCLALGFAVGKFVTKIQLGKVLCELEARGIIKIQEVNRND